jgi:hypothetical protein
MARHQAANPGIIVDNQDAVRIFHNALTEIAEINSMSYTSWPRYWVSGGRPNSVSPTAFRAG